MLRRMSLAGDAMSHAILPGAAIGYLVAGLSLPAMTLGGLSPAWPSRCSPAASRAIR
jgi:zinc/manganese transport system permease protein